MKKIVSLLLVLSFLLVPVSAAEGSSPAAIQEPLKVLTIGNSFTNDSMYLLNSAALAQGDTPMVLGWLYRGGCSLEMHSKYIKNETKAYSYYKNTDGTTVETEDSTFLDGLLDEDWDIIFLQQVSGSSGIPGDYDPYLSEVVDFVNANKTNPDAKIGWHMTWAYQKAYKDSGNSSASSFLKNFNGDPYTMYSAIVSTAQEKVLSRTVEADGVQVPEFTYLVPSGTAIENARTSYFGDNLQRDTYHLNRLGRVIASYTWYSYLTGEKLTSVNISDEAVGVTLSAEDRQVILESVNNALAKPFERTFSQYTQRPAEDVYYVLDNPVAEGGTVEGYHQNDPTTKVTVSYTGKVNDVGAKGFYKLVDGQLVAQRIQETRVATVSLHNYFVSYDANTQTLITKDGTSATGHSASKCGFRCIAAASSGHCELPTAVYDVPATTPVVDVTGKDHGISTLQDVVDLGATGHNIRLNHYSADATAPTAFYVDEITTVEDFYAPQEGDVFFIPTAVEAGSRVEAYIIKSDTVAAGTKKLVSVPVGSGDATGNSSFSLGRFWTMEEGVFVKQKGVYTPFSAAGAYKFAYHDTITSYTPATATAAGTIKVRHANGHTGTTTACGWNFNNSCGLTSTTRYGETYATLILSEDLTIIDLTGNNCTTVEQVKALTDVENAVINVYAANGTGTTSTTSNYGKPVAGAVADVLVVLNPKSNFTPNSVVSVGALTNGTVTVSPAYGQVGTEVTVTATPADGYVLDKILVDGTAITGTTFAISKNHTVTATFVADGSEPEEPEQPSEYTLQDGDVFFVPGTVKAGNQVEAYIVNSATVAAGTKVNITIPSDASAATGWKSNSRGRFWVMNGTEMTIFKGIYHDETSAQAYKFAYHDTITSYTAATADAAGTIEMAHASGHTGKEGNCGWAFAHACGLTSATRKQETCATLTLSDNLTIIDLTGTDYSGRGITTMDKIMEQVALGNVIVNVYAANGTQSSGTADVIIVMDPEPNFEPTVPYTMQENDVLYLLDKLYKGSSKQVMIASAKNGKPGQIETITAPNGDGSDYNALRMARVTASGELSVQLSFLDSYTAGLEYKLGVHEPLNAVDTINKTFTMGKFADGYHAGRTTCPWNSGSETGYMDKGYHIDSHGAKACENTALECASIQSYDSNTAFMDLRTYEATGKVSDIKALTVDEFAALAGDQNIMLEVYVPDGAEGTSGTASLVVIMPTHPTETIYNVKAGAVENGTIALSATSGLANAEITVTATPAEGFVLDTLKVGEVDVTANVVDNTYTFALTASVEVVATFKEAPAAPTTFAISVGTVANGTVTVDKLVAEAGETVTVTATPAAGYRLVSIAVNGTAITGNTFTVEGASEVTATFAEVIKFAGKTLTMADALAVNIYLKPAVFDALGLTGAYVKLEGPVEAQNRIIPQSEWEVAANGYKFAYEQIPAKMMGETISATVYDAEGNVVSETLETSVRDYAAAVLANAKQKNYQKRLAVDVLDYGAEAQVQFNYKTDDLANNVVTAEQRAAYGSPRVLEYTDKSEKVLNNNGSTFTLSDSIIMNMFFKVSTIDDSTYALIKMTHHNSDTETVVRVEKEDLSIEKNGLRVMVTEAKAADCRQLITCEVYQGGQMVACGRDNLESYVARAMKSNPTKYGWYEKILVYADSAYHYLHNLWWE